MGHEIKYAVYPEKVNKGSVQSEWDNYVRCACWKEGANGLAKPIRWLPDICETKEDAMKYIRSHDQGSYNQLAVRFRSVESFPALVRDLEKKLLEASRKHGELKHKFHFADAKAAYISCKSCGSKIARTHLKTNLCPVCYADMRPETVLKQVERAGERVDKLRERIEELKRKASTNSKNLKWLVKIEYHV